MTRLLCLTRGHIPIDIGGYIAQSIYSLRIQSADCPHAAQLPSSFRVTRATASSFRREVPGRAGSAEIEGIFLDRFLDLEAVRRRLHNARRIDYVSLKT